MQTTGTLEEINIDYKTGKPKISFLINDKHKLSDIEQLKGLKLKIEAKKYIKKRTTNANNYFWKLLQEICELADIDTIEEYKRRVKELGIFRRFKIEKDNVNTFEKMWTAQGIAWFSEIADTEYIGDTEFKIINVDITEMISSDELIENINNLQIDENDYYEIYLIGKRKFEIDKYDLKKMITNQRIIKLKNLTKRDYDIQKIVDENTLKGLFVKEILDRMENYDSDKELLENALEIGLEILDK